ncbi:hypothetical protein DDE18_00825 [Nocardioides gansuensis]|uniref:ABC3 transporter permease C-terminal domain-containing protein n=1 Tax=Nocardioides gansuensis TaxID=2138300 RepID=A0A2T8FER1_9ACTN|nr:hypothetical protein DDE18_00825 [Nocardioides gansuensis]
MLMFGVDADRAGAEVGDRVRLLAPEPPAIAGQLPRPPIDTVRLVGTYATPADDRHWFQPGTLSSGPERPGPPFVPYRPAPLVTGVSTFEAFPPGDWWVRIETRLDVPADLGADDLQAARAAAATLADLDEAVDGGTLTGVAEGDLNDLTAIEEEVRAQEGTARRTIAPALLSLVLVAFALLLRLLMAASELRVPELALASLRGVGTRRLWALGLAEPLVVLTLAAPFGVALGLVARAVLTRAWLVPGLPLAVPAVSWVAVALVLAGAVAVACVAVGLVVRRSLSAQLSGVRRPHRSHRWALVAQLVLVALALTVLASRIAGGRQAEPDATDLVLPVLLAVVAGLGATRVAAWLAAWWTRRSRGRSLSGFVSSRAVSRRQEGTLVILPITAAVAVAVFSAGVHDSAATWRASVAATVSPAHTTWHSPLGLTGTVAMTRQLDPEGEWLMTAASAALPGAGLAVVDRDRLASVAAWPPTWSPGRSVEDVVDALGADGHVPSVAGRRVSVTLDNQVATSTGLTLELRLGQQGSRLRRLYLGPFESGTSTLSARLRDCDDGCPLEGMTLGGSAGTAAVMAGRARILALEVDGRRIPFEGAGWSSSSTDSSRSAIADMQVGESLDLTFDTGGQPAMARLTSGGFTAKRPALRGLDVVDDALLQFDGSAYPALDVRGRLDGMPFAGPAGLLVDHTALLTDRPVYESVLDTRVLMREGAPAAMREALADAGLTVETTLAAERRLLDQSAYALALRLYGLVAVLVLLMALAGLAVSTAVQLPARRRDAAALRVVGVPRRAVMAAVAREFASVLGAAAAAGIAAGALAQWVVLRSLTLGHVEALSSPRVVAAISPSRLMALGVIAVVALGLAAYVSALLAVRGARGATLRENAR